MITSDTVLDDDVLKNVRFAIVSSQPSRMFQELRYDEVIFGYFDHPR